MYFFHYSTGQRGFAAVLHEHFEKDNVSPKGGKNCTKPSKITASDSTKTTGAN